MEIGTASEEGRFDQCVFIRSIRVVKNLLGKLRAAALAEPESDNRPPESSPQCCSSWDSGSENSDLGISGETHVRTSDIIFLL